jgi:hypothetical protein
MADLPALPEIA